jgi:hypothetical protein
MLIPVTLSLEFVLSSLVVVFDE